MLEKIKQLAIEKDIPTEIVDSIQYACQAGSHIHRTDDETSDFDYRVIVVPDEDYQIGLKKFTHKKILSGVNGINQFMDLDVEFFNYETFLLKAYYGEVIPIEMLFLEEPFVLMKSEILSPIFENRELFLSESIVIHYSGAIKEHTYKAFAPVANLKRPDKIERATKYGFETKDAMKAVLYLRICIELLKTGQLNLTRCDYQELLAIKQGSISSIEEMKQIIEQLQAEKESLLKNSRLPQRADFEKVNNFFKMYKKHVFKTMNML